MKPQPPTRIWLAVVFMVLMMSNPSRLYTQHESAARAAGIGAYTALAGGLGALDWNPAGLTQLGTWQLGASSGMRWSRDFDLPFLSTALGRSFGPFAAAARYSPGIALDFSVPSSITVRDSVGSFRTSFDKELAYAELFAAGYALRLTEGLSIGIAAHSFEERVSDTRYSRDSTGAIRSSALETSAATVTFDAGILWQPFAPVRVGITGKNIGRILGSRLPEDLASFALSKRSLIRAGAIYTGLRNLLLSADADQEGSVRAGFEWGPADQLRLRAGVYADKTSPAGIDAIGVGAGLTVGRVALNAGYLAFTDQSTRTGKGALSQLQQLSVTNLEYNLFSPDRLSFSAAISLGRTGDPELQIEYADIKAEIFPSAHTLYAIRPVGRARVKNLASAPRAVRVSFFIDDVMDRPTETAPVTLQPEETREIPFYAVFNRALPELKTLSIREGVVEALTSAASDPDDQYPLRVLLRGRNDWDGDAAMLKYFITPQDADVLSYTRAVLGNARNMLDSLAAETGQFHRARILFDDFSRRLQYVRDPKLSQDNVQYPAETLRLNGGDCDDMTVAFATILSSIGMSVAFVDVVPPGRPDEGHIYLLFDTGIEAERSWLVSSNPKRFVIRPNERGRETVWIPLETTVITRGFDAAWDAGAQEYYNDVELRFGLARGWVKVVDLEIPG